MSYVSGIVRRLPPGALFDTYSSVTLIFLQAKRVQHMELMFLRLLHLLAHHPDFATSQEEMLDMAKFVRTITILCPSLIYDLQVHRVLSRSDCQRGHDFSALSPCHEGKDGP